MKNRDKVIRLATRYKEIERKIHLGVGGIVLSGLRSEVSDIASEMFDLGYSLPKLILRRQRENKNA